MIVDSFLYAGEWDMLELRYRTLRDVVDCFVPVACTVTHQGVKMPPERLQLPPKNDDRYQSPHDPKMLKPFVVAPTRLFPDGQRSAAGLPFYQLIERQQRAGVWQAVWSSCHPDVNDIVIVSDVDEIPDPSVVASLPDQFASRPVTRFVLQQRFHSTALRYLHPNRTWHGPTVTYWHNCDPHKDRQERAAIVDGTAHGKVIRDAGWHLSWFGTDDERDWKLGAFSHGEVADVWDTRAGRTFGQHSNGEDLVAINTRDTDWPLPFTDPTFHIPEAWR